MLAKTDYPSISPGITCLWWARCKLIVATSFMALDGVTSFLRLKDVTNTCKRMRRGLSIGGSFSVQRRKVGRS